MGLDISHNCWHGTYSSFNDFRYKLAEQVGINLDDYRGFRGNGGKDLSEVRHDLVPLLNHSDCDGKLTVKEAMQIAKGLDNILKNFNYKIQADCDFIGDIVKFRDGCLVAVSKNEDIDFH